ncbi:PREDICTED: putative BTB/POZ domain-containing protein At2g40440 [Tarenaya hassleriana]|uniref:putative BTB/POZ domain-containing protein At2g40440 n=1 Tax=Tarenaya hassleriana TaxID=28532 RepID=UPI00053C493A|nr:PREDICTED: putative BTB/POZ domain-containing protein At2g40440 [Tarenaya hassleriana]
MAAASNFDVFFGALFEAFQENRHVDIKLKSGDGTIVNAHKIFLSARSKVFRVMLEADECKTSRDETITLSELKHKELEALLEFLYKGSLTADKLKLHVRPLYLAADKYDIPYLQDVCRNHLISNLNSSSALDMLELSSVLSDDALNKSALDFVKKNIKDIAVLSEFDSFVERNPKLTVEFIKELTAGRCGWCGRDSGGARLTTHAVIW